MKPQDAVEDKTLTTALKELASKYDVLLKRWKKEAHKLKQRYPWLHIHQAARYLELLGEEQTESFLSTRGKQLMKTIRVNTLKTTTASLRRRLEEKGFQLRPHPYIDYGLVIDHAPYSPGASLEYLLGYYTIQGPASMLAVPALEPERAERIADMCAGAGVKTTQLAQHNPRAEIYAFDTNKRKLAALKNNLSRLGVANVAAYHVDARTAPSILGEEEAGAVLLDAPCSGEGLIPFQKGRWPRSFEDIMSRVKLQYQLAMTAARLLHPKGVLVYSTCTVSVEENEYLLTLLLETHPELKPEPPPIRGGIPGFTEYLGLPIEPSLREACRRFLPHIHATEGFTICRLRKT